MATNEKSWNWLTLVLPIVAGIVYFGERLAQVGEDQATSLKIARFFFRVDIIPWLLPVILGLSYIHLVQDDRLREKIYFFASFIGSFFALIYLPAFLAGGLGIYVLLAVGLSLIIKYGSFKHRWQVVGFSFLMIFVMSIYVRTDPLYLQLINNKYDRIPSGHLYVFGALLTRILISIPLILHDLPEIKKKSLFALGGYFLNPIFIFNYIPIGPSEYFSSFQQSKLSMNDRRQIIFRGWKLVVFSILLNAALSPFFLYPNLLDSAPYLAFLQVGGLIITQITFSTGLMKVCGFSIREPFKGILASKTPADIWTSWNVYGREWQIKFSFFPALRAGANFYGAFLWSFFVSGVNVSLKSWTLPLIQIPKNAAVLWLTGLWLTLIIFVYRRFQKKTNFFEVLQKFPTRLIQIFQWIAIILILTVPPYLQRIIYAKWEIGF